jgi:thioredoxin-related protein
MRTLRSLLPVITLLLFGLLHAAAQDAPWLSDYKAAVAQAKADHKNILMDFTGSDWCPWCIKMDKEVLDTKEFKTYAGKNLILMLVDFPQSKQLPQKVQDQNADLQKKFSADGFPTFVLTDPDGKVLGQQVGYLEGGPSAFITMLDGFKK